MTTVRHPLAPVAPSANAAVAHEQPCGPIGRIIVGSLGTGLLGAALLTLVVFAGADEHVITGSALLAFAFGWALLAALSIRLTNQPQRWALVPAVLMGVTGLTLLAFTPGNAGLTAASWVWPPAALALAAWMGIRMHQALTGRRRWLIYPVVALLAVAALGGLYESAVLERDQRTYAMRGTSYDIGGYRLHLHCTGTGLPTVVLESGLGETSASWSRITTAVGHTTRVCAYDRAGQGWSDDAPHPQDGREIAADLHTLLDRANETGPYVLVGHSAGGAYAMTYAARYPAEVAGMVLLDSMNPYQDATISDAPPAGMLALLPSLARLGITQLIPSSTWSSLPEPAAGQVRAFASSPRGMRNIRDEVSVYPAVLTQARSLRTMGAKPVVVVTAYENRNKLGWAAAHSRMAALSSNSSHRYDDTSHAGLLDQQSGSEASVRAINDVVQAVRAGASLVTS